MTTLVLAATASLMATTAALAQVETRSLSFANGGVTLSGTLFLPEGHDGSALPTVVVTGAWTSVQEQMPRVYAERMVERGFAAVT
ncbi:MAG: alpha/beta hydrolase, partial [Pseudomonadota bacterium]